MKKKNLSERFGKEVGYAFFLALLIGVAIIILLGLSWIIKTLWGAVF